MQSLEIGTDITSIVDPSPELVQYDLTFAGQVAESEKQDESRPRLGILERAEMLDNRFRRRRTLRRAASIF